MSGLRFGYFARAKLRCVLRAGGDGGGAELRLHVGGPPSGEEDIFGYHVNLETQMVLLSERNQMKSLYAFASVDLAVGAKVTVKTVLMAVLSARQRG
jgi:hypothetical protein